MVKNICPRCTEITLSFADDDEVSCPKCTHVFTAEGVSNNVQEGGGL